MLSVVSHLRIRDYVPNIFCETTFNSDGYCHPLLFFPQSKLFYRFKDWPIEKQNKKNSLQINYKRVDYFITTVVYIIDLFAFLCNDVNKNLTRSNSYLCAHVCVPMCILDVVFFRLLQQQTPRQRIEFWFIAGSSAPGHLVAPAQTRVTAIHNANILYFIYHIHRHIHE